VTVSTHVLDAVSGRPADGVTITLEHRGPTDWQSLGSATTDTDGRVRDFGPVSAGIHRLTFETGAYFARIDMVTFYPEVGVTFEITDPDAHHHVPLLLSPFAYSTYRGS
jgi:5-hydroxyisourate hydrolase